MNYTLTVTQIGNSLGVILPKEVVAKLRVEKGEKLFATEQPDGFSLRGFDPEFAAQMAVAEKIMHEDRDVLRELAK